MGVSTWIYTGWNQEIKEEETLSHEQWTCSKLTKTVLKKIQNAGWVEMLQEEEKKATFN
jgi:hypothetical protein